MQSHEETCPGGLKEIYSGTLDHMSEWVVRWCSNCGAVVIDEDYDGRTKPGGVMKMKFPKGTVFKQA